eukprot:220562-Rhodomonas_salina.2
MEGERGSEREMEGERKRWRERGRGNGRRERDTSDVSVTTQTRPRRNQTIRYLSTGHHIARSKSNRAYTRVLAFDFAALPDEPQDRVWGPSFSLSGV